MTLPTPDEFRASLDRAASVVRTWPAWKQQVLGGTAVTTPDNSVKCNTCPAWTAPGPNHAATGTQCAKCRYPDQAAADRERIAGEMNKPKPIPVYAQTWFLELGNAVRAFEVLCEPCEWRLEWRKGTAWTLTHPRKAYGGMAHPLVSTSDTGSHAADVCRLVCEVLDREAKG